MPIHARWFGHQVVGGFDFREYLHPSDGSPFVCPNCGGGSWECPTNHHGGFELQCSGCYSRVVVTESPAVAATKIAELS